ncbi:DNA cytosine methyltransferase [Rhizobium sp. P007]|uniref:DNA cytosine methyltransferase n=1 Tax=Rhizobium sp. P007 TaxID=285908 RepID=UPI0019F2CA6A|nr:DNA cytosine methyltransferase [Rhizobium sp. P007]CAD7057904.1 DNA cytosine methyltransferase [Rhizobium sp. P007]
MKHENDNKTGLRFLSVCSGIEAASVAWHPLGWKAVAFSEIEKFPSAVLKHHYPDVPNLGDFTKIDTKTLGHVDVLAGGTPCQAFSVAGLRRSLADARGNLSLEFVRLAHELAANNGLRNVVWENVVGVLSTKDNAFGCFLAGLVGADSAIEPPRRGKWARHGMVSGPKGRAAWAVKDGQFFGVAQ